MPTAMHFLSLQYWQRLRLIRRMLHCWFLVQGRYWIFCWMLRLKKPCGPHISSDSLWSLVTLWGGIFSSHTHTMVYCTYSVWGARRTGGRRARLTHSQAVALAKVRVPSPLHAPLRTEHSPISLFTPLLVQEPCAPYHTISVTVVGRGKVLQGKIASPTVRDVDMRTVEPYPNITSGPET